MHQNPFSAGAIPDPAGELTTLSALLHTEIHSIATFVYLQKFLRVAYDVASVYNCYRCTDNTFISMH